MHAELNAVLNKNSESCAGCRPGIALLQQAWNMGMPAHPAWHDAYRQNMKKIKKHKRITGLVHFWWLLLNCWLLMLSSWSVYVFDQDLHNAVPLQWVCQSDHPGAALSGSESCDPKLSRIFCFPRFTAFTPDFQVCLLSLLCCSLPLDIACCNWITSPSIVSRCKAGIRQVIYASVQSSCRCAVDDPVDTDGKKSGKKLSGPETW